jgi:4-amino-4-deoxy-L-arabinose transferase
MGHFVGATRLRTRDAAAFGIAAATFWIGLGSYGLVEPSDARYGEIAREMWASGDYLFPNLLGIHHFHKPPLIYWLSALGFALLGPTEWGARACLGALALVLGFTVWRFARRHLGPEVAPWSLALMATTPALIGAGRMLTTDLLLATCLVLALTSWYDVWTGARGTRALLVFYAATGSAFLAKGPVGWLILLLVLAPFALLCRGQGARRTPSWGLRWGIPLALAIALPWYAYAVVKTPGLLAYFLGGQTVSRLSESGMGHSRPWFYFLWVFPALGLPWVLFAPGGWKKIVGEKRSLATFLAFWSLVPPVFFSLPSTKLPLYVLPAYPALALLAARALTEESPVTARPLQYAGALFLVLGAALAVVGLGVVPLRGGDVVAMPPGSLARVFLPLALVSLIGGGCAIGWAREWPGRAAVALVCAVACLPVWAATTADLLPLRSARTVGLAAARELRPTDVLVEYRDLSAGLPFYAGTMPMLARIGRETQFDGREAEQRLLDREAFQKLWAGPQRVLAVTLTQHAKDLPMGREIARGGGYVLVANR